METTLEGKKGFTLVEMMVAITIVGILAAIVFTSLSTARANSRDKARVADISQLELALRLYVEKNGSEIDCEGGVKIDGTSVYNAAIHTLAGAPNQCNDAGQILSFVEAFMGSVPSDPKGPNNLDYYYYFDNRHACLPANKRAPLVFAVNLESGTSNANQVCTDVSGNEGGYMETVTWGGSINPSVPYVKRLTFTEEI